LFSFWLSRYENTFSLAIQSSYWYCSFK
jgi:hypothetical protein